jgi:hypothetical protein
VTARKRAVVETTHERAATVAAALRPDNTDSMTTTVDGTTVRTEIERDTTGGLQSTVDDYVVNLAVAETVAETATRHARPGRDTHSDDDSRRETHDTNHE